MMPCRPVPTLFAVSRLLSPMSKKLRPNRLLPLVAAVAGPRGKRLLVPWEPKLGGNPAPGVGNANRGASGRYGGVTRTIGMVTEPVAVSFEGGVGGVGGINTGASAALDCEPPV